MCNGEQNFPFILSELNMYFSQYHTFNGSHGKDYFFYPPPTLVLSIPKMCWAFSGTTSDIEELILVFLWYPASYHM
jgi:hypothetical protein